MYNIFHFLIYILLSKKRSFMLDKKILLKIKKIEKELASRKVKNKVLYYNTSAPFHYKQIAFHKAPQKNRWVFGGNRSGKTECGAVEVVYMARGIHPYRKNKQSTTGWVVSLSQQVQRDVAQSKILHYLNPDWIVDISMLSGKKDNPQNGVIDFITIKNIFGGISRIGFKSCDQGREKFQGTSLDYVWFDEEPPFDIYNECLMRVLDKKGDIFGTMTPLKGLTWVYTQIYLNPTNSPDIWCEFMQWEDNPFLDSLEIKKLEQTLSKVELESRKYGKFASSSGLVYTEFDEAINVIEPFTIPQDWQDNISIDPGLNNPLACHFYAVDYDGNIYVVGEHFMQGKTVEYHAQKIIELAKKLNWHFDSSGRLSALIDSAANQKTLASNKSVSELFYDNGILVNPKVNKDLFSGISKVKSYLKNAQGESKLFIFKNCTNLIREIKSYFWGNNDVPIKKDDHCLDELRYYIMSRPENAKPTTQKSQITKDKDRLIRRIKHDKVSL